VEGPQRQQASRRKGKQLGGRLPAYKTARGARLVLATWPTGSEVKSSETHSSHRMVRASNKTSAGSADRHTARRKTSFFGGGENAVPPKSIKGTLFLSRSGFQPLVVTHQQTGERDSPISHEPECRFDSVHRRSPSNAPYRGRRCGSETQELYRASMAMRGPAQKLVGVNRSLYIRRGLMLR